MAQHQRYTVLIVPEGASKVRRVQVPGTLVAALAAAGFAALVLVAVVAWAYIADRARLSQVAAERSALALRNESQQGQIEVFASRIQELESRMAQMGALDRKVRAMANLREQREAATPAPMFSVGGTTVEDERWAFSLYNVQTALMQDMQAELDRLSVEASVQEHSLKELSQSLLERNLRIAGTPSAWPTRGLVTSGFGERANPITGIHQFHTGLDIASGYGSAVYATAAGTVVYVGRHGGLGRLVMIAHQGNLATRYAHLSQTYVNVGDRVTRGTKIGAVGNSGSSTGPHLHYEVLKRGVPVNPRRFID